MGRKRFKRIGEGSLFEGVVYPRDHPPGSLPGEAEGTDSLGTVHAAIDPILPRWRTRPTIQL